MAVACPPTVSSPALRPPLLSRFALALGALLLAAVVLDVLGVAGYRHGAPLVAAGLALGGALVSWLLTRRPWFAVPVAVLGVMLSGLLASRAPWSTGRLEAVLDDLEHLDGFEVLESERRGHSWCRPECPSVTRTWRAPDTSPRASVLVMTLSLAEARLAPPMDAIGARVLTDELAIRGDETDLIVRAERLEPGDLRVTVVLSSHR